MLLCLGEPSVRFLLLFIFAPHFVVALHLLLFFISFPGYFFMSSTLHLGFSVPWRPPPALSSIPRLLLIAFAFSSTARVLWFWVGVCYPQAFFTLNSPSPTFLTQRFVYQGLSPSSLGTDRSSLTFARLHTDDPRNIDPAHLFVWFTVTSIVIFRRIHF